MDHFQDLRYLVVGRSAAEDGVVYVGQIDDGGSGAAHGAVGLFRPQLDDAEGAALAVEHQHPLAERRAAAQNQFDGFHGLQSPHEAGDLTENKRQEGRAT